MQLWIRHTAQFVSRAYGSAVPAILLFIIALFSQNTAHSQTTQGIDFWLTPMINYTGATDSFFVIVSAEKATNAKVEIPLLGFTQSISLGYNDLIRVYIPNTYKPQSGDTIFRCGIHVTSFLPVSVYSLSARSATTDASCIFPSAVQPRGGEYYCLTPILYTGGYNSGNTIGIVSIDDSTVVEITPTVKTGSGYTAGVPFKKKLRQGEVYIFTSANKIGLEGSKIKASAGKRIAVFAGDICVAIRCAACDHVYEEIPPVATLGKNFIVTPFFKQDKGHDFQVVATENATLIKENGTPVALIDAGKTYYRKVYGDSSLCITADKPVLLVQYMIGKSCGATVGGDPAMLVVNPLEQTIQYSIVSTSNTTLVKTHYINIIVPKSGLDSVYLDGSLLLPYMFDTLSCGNYFLYRDTVQAGNHRIECRYGFICYLYGIGTYESYAYSAGSGLRNLQRYILSQSYPSCDSGFIVKLSSFGDSAVGFRWTFNNNQYDTSKNPFFYVKTPGVYSVKLLYKSYGKKTWDSTFSDVLIEKPQFSDYITFDTKTVCDSVFKINLPNTPIFSYKWNTGDTTAWLYARKTGKYSVNVHNRITGCDAVDSCYLNFFNAVQVKMTFKMARFCPGIPLYLYDSSKVKNDSIISYNWYADKYPISKLKNDTIKSPRANSYDIKLVINTANGCMDSAQEKVFISDVPVAVAGVSKYDTCYGTNKFRFNNGSYTNLGKITRLKWLFGDGDTSAKLQAYKSYADSGQYWVRLIAYSETGCYDTSDAIKVTVNPTPRAEINVIDSAICLKSNYFDFRNGSAKDSRPMGFLWNWGDGTGSTYENPGQIPYTDTGTYLVKFSPYFLSTGCRDTAYRIVRVVQDPKASMVIDSSNFCLNANFYQLRSNSDSKGSKNGLETWYWGDGSSVSGVPSFKKTYTTSGTFKVKLVYTTGKGCIDSVQKNVVIYNSPVSQFVISDSSACGTNNYFIFNNQSTAPVNARWTWDFGDGNNSTVKNPSSKNYGLFGNYTIMLVVKDPLTNCTDTSRRLVTVLKAPQLKIHTSDTTVCRAANSFTFTDSTDYGNVKPLRNWIFSSSETDTNAVVQHAYSKFGNYTVQFVGGIPGVCADTMIVPVHVRYPDTVLTISQSQSKICAPGSVNLIAQTALGSNWSFTWTDINSGRKWNTATVNNAIFSSAGTFPVSTVITDDLGCKDSLGFDVVILPKPKLQLTELQPNSQCLKGNLYSFSAAYNNVTWPAIFDWNIDGNAYSDSATQPISFNTPGSKPVRVILKDKNLCSDTTSTTVEVYPQLGISIDPDSGCLGESRTLIAQVTPASVKTSSIEWYKQSQLVFTGNPYSAMLSAIGVENIFVVTQTDKGCQDTSNTVQLTTFAKPMAKYGIIQYTATGLGIPVDFLDSSTGASRWQWTAEPGILGYSKSFSHLYNHQGWEQTQLIVQNDQSCADTAYLKIQLLSNEYGWVPGTFTPDGNGINDVFKIEGLSAVTQFEMVIFNRWGEQLFRTTNPTIGWDGNFMGKPAMDGVYAYRINLIFFTGKRQVLQGEVTLLR